MTGIEARYMFVYSGGAANEKELEGIHMKVISVGHNIHYSQIGSATQVGVIRENIRTAYNILLPIVLFSTQQNIQLAVDGIEELEGELISIDELQYELEDEKNALLDFMNYLKGDDKDELFESDEDDLLNYLKGDDASKEIEEKKWGFFERLFGF